MLIKKCGEKIVHTQDKKAVSYIILDSFKWVVYNSKSKKKKFAL